MKVLLIGGSGFIGRHLARSLAARNDDVLIIGRNSPTTPEASSIRHTVGSYADTPTLRAALQEVDAVVHLAHDSLQLNQTCDMAAEYSRNILPSINLMEECLRANVAKLIFVSSGGTVYGNTQTRVPLKENATTAPISLYGTSKLSIEQIAHLYHVQRGLPVVIVRPGNAYGPGQIPFKGQGIIATALASALIQRPIAVFGDGGAIRDYVHVRDISEAILQLLHSSISGEVFNIGTGIGTSIIDLLEKHLQPLVEASGYSLILERKPVRSMDVGYNVLDSEKLKTHIEYSPIPLRDGLPETWGWVKDQWSKVT